MSEGEVLLLRREIKELSDKSDSQHRENREQQQKDRDAFQRTLSDIQSVFAREMSSQRQMFQEALNKQYIEHLKTDSLVVACIGNGQPGQGRLGALEQTVEVLKKFRWQAVAIISAALLLVEKLEPYIKH